MAGPTYNWTQPADPAIRNYAGVALTNTAVTLGDSFTPTLSDTDDFAIAMRLEAVVIDSSTRGTFTLPSNISKGTEIFDVQSGKGTNFTVGDLVLFRDSGGTEVFRARVESKSTDEITLEDRILVDMDTTYTVEIPGKITVSGNEGAGSGQSAQTRVSTIWLVDHTERSGWIVTRWRYDAGATLTIQTTGFVADKIYITPFLDIYNFYRSDRNTDRLLMTAAATHPQAGPPGNTFNNPWLVHASGHPASRQGAPSDYFRVAEQHPPVRLSIEVTGFVDNGGPANVVIRGLRTNWTPIKSAIAGSGGGGSDQDVWIPIENYNQFQTVDPRGADVLLLHNLANGNQDAVTLASKTFASGVGPRLNFTAVPTNNYAVDDVIGIVQTETIPITANGTYWTTDAWVYPLGHYTSGGGDDFDYQISSSVQGVFGCLRSVDKRLNEGVTVASELGHLGSYQGIADSSWAATNTAAGCIGGHVSYPRQGATFSTAYFANSNRCLWQFGIVNDWGQGATGVSVLRGSRDTVKITSDVRGGALSADVVTATQLISNKVYLAADSGGPLINIDTPANSYRRNLMSTSPGISTQNTDNAILKDVYATSDRGQGAIPTSPAATLSIVGASAPKLAKDFRHFVVLDAYAQGASFGPAQDWTGATEILRMTNYNSELVTGVGDLAHRVSMGTRGLAAYEYTAAFLDSYIRKIKCFSTGNTDPRTLQSRHSLNVQVIDETGQPLEGASVVAIDNIAPGTPIVNVTTDFAGKIQQQELISHSWLMLNTAGNPVWNASATTGLPTGVTLTDFNPFELIIAPKAGEITGLVPARFKFTLPALLPNPLNFVVILYVPRPDGQFGDAGFGEF